jgi:hypothetical protein
MTLSAGAAFTIDASGTTTLSSGKLDSSNAIVAYRDGSGHSARIVQSDETVGAEYSFAGTTAGGNRTVAVDGLSATSAISARVRDDNAEIATLVLSISGTTITSPGGEVGIGGDGLEANISIVALSATSAIVVFGDDNTSTQGTAVYITISGTTITNESSVVFEPSAGSGIANTALVRLSATKAIVVYEDADDSNRLKAVTLSITGVTISAGSSTTIDSPDVGDHPSLAEISATTALLCYQNITDGDIKAAVLSSPATTVTVGALLIIDTNDGTNTAIAGFSTTQFVATWQRSSNSAALMQELSISGTTVSLVNSSSSFDTISTDNSLVAYGATTALAAFVATIDGVIITLSAVAGLGLAAMTKPADIDASGTFVYVALLDGGTPILTKISIALDSDGTTVFDPGSGTNIGVECGRNSANTIWIAGAFDGTNVVEKSEDAGSSFTVKDDATIGNVRTFVMGPDNDEKLLVFDETNGDILETVDDGTSWDTINASVTPEINAIGRLGENVEESVFGNDGGVSNSINYSVNSGDDLEDFQTGVYPNANATRVIVN